MSGFESKHSEFISQPCICAKIFSFSVIKCRVRRKVQESHGQSQRIELVQRKKVRKLNLATQRDSNKVKLEFTIFL